MTTKSTISSSRIIKGAWACVVFLCRSKRSAIEIELKAQPDSRPAAPVSTEAGKGPKQAGKALKQPRKELNRTPSKQCSKTKPDSTRNGKPNTQILPTLSNAQRARWKNIINEKKRQDHWFAGRASLLETLLRSEELLAKKSCTRSQLQSEAGPQTSLGCSENIMKTLFQYVEQTPASAVSAPALLAKFAAGGHCRVSEARNLGVFLKNYFC